MLASYSMLAIPGLRGWEWIIILVIVILVFGVGRIGKLGGELGSGIRAFREGLKTDESQNDVEEEVEEAPAEEKPKKKKKKKAKEESAE
jgi:sec-independent protein translocase protein TatA